ncbi:MAG: phosphodiester glycosidase family protein [Bacilli bacterium]|nr:phosphodiester glycosidase family protein [Bacilli bacterium]
MIIIKKYLISIIYTVFIIFFTIFIILDTFVIKQSYQIVKNETTENTSSGTITKDDNSYKDDNIEINLKEYRQNDTTIYVADIVLKDQNYLKTAFAESTYGKNITENTSDIAKEVNAILAINGDYYGVQKSGYVLKNGTIYRNTSAGNEDLVIYKNGTFEIINENDVTAEELLEKGAYNILSFGPALITNNKIVVSENDEVAKAMNSNPRTAIGKISDNHYVFVVSDGRTTSSEGLTLYQLASFMQTLNCQTAYNLDGGGSSTMYFNGNIVNNPTTNGKVNERSVSDIVYIGY